MMKVNNIQIVGWVWFSGRDTVGIVIYRTRIGDFYAAIGGDLAGINEESDIAMIADYGQKHFPLEAAVICVAESGVIEDLALWDELKNELKEKQ